MFALIDSVANAVCDEDSLNYHSSECELNDTHETRTDFKLTPCMLVESLPRPYLIHWLVVDAGCDEDTLNYHSSECELNDTQDSFLTSS